MNDLDAAALLERAAASVTPALTDPGHRLADVGRRRERRRRRTWGAGVMALVVAAVAVGVATPVLHRVHDVLPASRPAHGTKASFGSLTLVLPGDWRVEAGADADVCTAP